MLLSCMCMSVLGGTSSLTSRSLTRKMGGVPKLYRVPPPSIAADPVLCPAAPAAPPLSLVGPTATAAVSLAMGHRRILLLGLAVVVLFAVDGAAAASKGAPRAGSQQRRSAKASRSSRPSRRDIDEDEREFQGWDGETKKATRRSSSSKSSGAARDDGSVGRRVRPSSTPGSSRSSSRLVPFARVRRVAT